MRIAIFVQNGDFGRAALKALLGAPHRPWVPRLIVEGPSGSKSPSMLEKASLKTLLRLGLSLSDERRHSPLGWALTSGAAHVSVGSIAPVQWLSLAKLLSQMELDALVCLGFHVLLPPQILACAPLGLNVHPSLLPQFRGPSPIFWWLKSHGTQAGVSVHHLDRRADRGMLVAQKAFDVPAQLSGRRLAELFGRAGGQQLAWALGQAQAHQLYSWPQKGPGVWAPRPTPEDAEVRPKEWTGRHLLRFLSGAGLWRTPRVWAGESTFFARRGLDFFPDMSVPGDFVQTGDQILVEVQDGAVSLEAQL